MIQEWITKKYVLDGPACNFPKGLKNIFQCFSWSLALCLYMCCTLGGADGIIWAAKLIDAFIHVNARDAFQLLTIPFENEKKKYSSD